MTLTTTFKSHFKIKKNFYKNKKKVIFVKNMVFFFLFTKVFFTNFDTSLMFQKKTLKQLSLLKAPSRHKNFFHQTCIEVFILKIFFYYKCNTTISLHYFLNFFKKLNIILKKIGSNTLTRTKFSIESKFYITNLLG